MTLDLPENFHVRPPMLDDVERVVDLSRLCQQREWGSSEITVEDTLALWKSPGVELGLDARLIFAPDEQLIAYLLLLRRDPFHMVIAMRVHPDYATIELYSALLARAEERAYQVLPQLRSDVRISLETTCSTLANAETTEAIKRAGFAYVRSTWRMEIEMDAPPAAPIWPEGIVLRPFTPELARIAHAAVNEAFSDHWGHTPLSFETFEHMLIKNPEFDPTLWFLAFEGEEIAGMALCERKGGVAFVDNLSVRRPWRRHGLGIALLYQAFGEFYRRGERRVALYVDTQSLTGATRLYQRAGMQVTRQLDMYEKELRAGIELSTREIEE